MMIQIWRSTTRSEVMKRTPPTRSPREDSSGAVTLITRSSESGSRPVNTEVFCVASACVASSVDARPPPDRPDVESRMRPFASRNCCSSLSCSLNVVTVDSACV